jgi:hypothetical protein
MSVKRLAMMLGALGLIASGAVHGQAADKCGPHKIHQLTFPGDSPKEVAAAMRANVILSPNWNDARILAAFGLATAIPDRDIVHGADGSQVNYHAGKTEIHITRSASTGLAVTVGGRGPYAGIWHIAGCD